MRIILNKFICFMLAILMLLNLQACSQKSNTYTSYQEMIYSFHNCSIYDLSSIGTLFQNFPKIQDIQYNDVALEKVEDLYNNGPQLIVSFINTSNDMLDNIEKHEEISFSAKKLCTLLFMLIDNLQSITIYTQEDSDKNIIVNTIFTREEAEYLLGETLECTDYDNFLTKYNKIIEDLEIPENETYEYTIPSYNYTIKPGDEITEKRIREYFDLSDNGDIKVLYGGIIEEQIIHFDMFKNRRYFPEYENPELIFNSNGNYKVHLVYKKDGDIIKYLELNVEVD